MSAGGDYLFTSESVTAGHPDKLADTLSDALLDAALDAAPGARDTVRAAVECFLTGPRVLVAGEVSASLVEALRDLAPGLAREVVGAAGYDEESLGMAPADLVVDATDLKAQSEEIRRGTEAGAGDQGLMFGYANREAAGWLPAPIAHAHALARRLAQVREDGTLPWLRPDGKSQVTVRFAAGRPVGIDTVVLSAQHDPVVEGLPAASDEPGGEAGLAKVREALREEVVAPAVGDHLLADPAILVQSAGLWNKGGPAADTGLTGRKIVVDTYGGRVPHGGGAFSGKDPTKVDRSGSYFARWAAVEALRILPDLEWVELQVAYSIHGEREVADPFVRARPKALLPAVNALVGDLGWGMRQMIGRLGLWGMAYRPLAAYGHFGREDLHLPWDPPRD